MDKKHADQIATDFIERIFGFALGKTHDADKATELAARITFAVYTSLLRADAVQNVDGYVYRIAQNVYARFVDEEVRGRHIALDNVRISAPNDFTREVEDEEIYRHLRRQVSFLGKVQRQVVVMYYFDRLKQSEIARRLRLPPGTVKWHLHEAKNQLKGGFNKMHTPIHLGLKPIQFNGGAWSSGNPMPGKGTDFYLQKLIAQNIAYAAYWQPRTIPEIAEALGVPAAFIEDEVAVLEAYSFLDALPGGKYQTNMFIMRLTKETMERKHELFQQYAKPLCAQYIPQLLAAIHGTEGFYTPKGDANFLRWAMVSYACKHKFQFKPGPYNSKYRVKRKDGGDYIAGATLFDEDEMNHLSYNANLYTAPNNMSRWGEGVISSWQLTTYYDTRSNDYEDNRYEDYVWLHQYMTGTLPKTPTHADKFKRLYDKGYLMEANGTDYVNMVVTTHPYNALCNLLPNPSDALVQLSDELDKQIYALEKDKYPPHMQEMCRLWCANCFAEQDFVAYVLAELLADGTLHLPTG